MNPPRRAPLLPKVVETHTSLLFMAGDRVVKVRKPVAYGFADFTDVRHRRQLCRREVALNRRLSPDVYLGTASLHMGRDVVEHAVVMRRLPEDRSLAALVAQDGGAGTTDLTGQIDRVAATLARFHSGARRSPRIARQGSAAAQWRRWSATGAELERFAGQPIDRAAYFEATELAGEYLRGRADLFGLRVDEGAVCDGHGDLQAADVYCLEDGPRLLDCLEFDSALRAGDVLADVAFLALDLERLGAPQAANHLLARYACQSGRDQPASLTHFYLAARAQVRLVVECLRMEQGLEGSGAVPVAAALRLMRDHLLAARVRVVLVGGPPGSGKTTVATALAGKLGWEVVSTDHVRPAAASAYPEEQRYGPAAKEAAYAELLARAEGLARQGRSVLLDATWTQAGFRRRAAQMARRASAQLLELRCACPPDVAAARVARRLDGGSGESDATPEVAARLRAQAAPWPGALTVDTVDSGAATVGTALSLLAARGVRPYHPVARGPSSSPAAGSVTTTAAMRTRRGAR